VSSSQSLAAIFPRPSPRNKKPSQIASRDRQSQRN